MLKESILFVAGTGLMVYFLAPTATPPEEKPVSEAVQQPLPTVQESPDDAWGYDEEESGADSFTFGDPMVELNGAEPKPNRPEPAQRSEPEPTPSGSTKAGSIYNPITKAPKDRPDPEPF
ncbi:hypothetical protein [Parasphingorhabdus sp.]|uniref:hypothetical protein n=1 Tax=Parasphingorhabdus sp. TaxID=2709688 RepID=UPI0030025757